MKAPTPDALRFAADWMRQYDDTHDGGSDTRIAEAVAAWLDQQADAACFRAAAKKFGVRTKAVRARAKASAETMAALRSLIGR